MEDSTVRKAPREVHEIAVGVRGRCHEFDLAVKSELSPIERIKFQDCRGVIGIIPGIIILGREGLSGKRRTSDKALKSKLMETTSRLLLVFGPRDRGNYQNQCQKDTEKNGGNTKFSASHTVFNDYRV
jgi:hypothetical protein